MLIRHRLDVRMWDGIKLVKVQLIVGADVDVGTLVLSAITVSWGGED